MRHFFQVVGDWGFFLFAVGLLTLGTAFLSATRWRTTPTGRGIGAFFICANAIITLSFLRLFQIITPDSNWFWILRAGVFLGGGLAVFTVAVAFVRLQFRRRRSGERTKVDVRLD